MKLILLTLLLSLIAPPSQRGAEIQLNLAAVAPPPERPSDRRGGEGCGSAIGSSSHAPPTKPLKVTLADTDRLGYTVGESMFFNVVLENTGAAPIVLGISRDPEVAPKTMRPCQIVPPGVHFQVALVAMSKKGPGMIITNGVGFYGSFDVPGTTVVLEPGERVRVQLAAEIRQGLDMDPVLTLNPQPVRIKAFVMIERESMMAEYSENALEIELRVLGGEGNRPW